MNGALLNERVEELAKVERIGTHSHVRGLGVDVGSLEAGHEAEGMVGQEKARRAAAVVAAMVKEGKIAGRVVLLSGKAGTGKTAIALAIARSIGKDTPFTHLAGSEVFSLDMSKPEVLTQSLRKSIGIRIKEKTEVLEGEVVELVIEKPLGPNASRKGTMTLRTTDMESLYNLGAKMIESLERLGITAGDVISIDKKSGRVSRIGRSFLRSTEYDAVSGSTKFVKTPSGEIQKTQEIFHVVTLHDIDVINSRAQGFLALFAGDTGEIKSEVRYQIDRKVSEWRTEGKAEIIPGILFIDEVHMLDLDSFSFLNMALESETAPIVIMATNRGVTKIRGSDYVSPHGIPLDFLDRALIIPTNPYTSDEIAKIIRQRLLEEDVSMAKDAEFFLTTIAVDTSLRYALHLVSVAAIAAKKRKSLHIELPDIERVYKLFLDVERSSKYLDSYQNQFISIAQ